MTKITVCKHCGGRGNIRTTRERLGVRENYRVCKNCGFAWSTIEIDREKYDEYRKLDKMVSRVMEDV